MYIFLVTVIDKSQQCPYNVVCAVVFIEQASSFSPESLLLHHLFEQEGAMPAPEGNQSEVARLLERINAEYEAAQRGLSGFAFGSAKHEFITARMENVGRLHDELHAIVGDESIALVAEALKKTS
jgi:hypothetical protein